MQNIKVVQVIILTVFISACSTNASPPGQRGQIIPMPPFEMPIKEEAEIISIAPSKVGEFTYTGVQFYPGKGGGYSLRYTLNAWNHADIYIYPVPDNIKQYSHKDIVFGMTKSAILGIEQAEKVGRYYDLKILNQMSSNHSEQITAKVDATYISENLASYSLLYLTEYNGVLIKARITMPDNESNRADKRWNTFVDKIFRFVIENIDKT